MYANVDSGAAAEPTNFSNSVLSRQVRPRRWGDTSEAQDIFGLDLREPASCFIWWSITADSGAERFSAFMCYKVLLQMSVKKWRCAKGGRLQLLTTKQVRSNDPKQKAGWAEEWWTCNTGANYLVVKTGPRGVSTSIDECLNTHILDHPFFYQIAVPFQHINLFKTLIKHIQVPCSYICRRPRIWAGRVTSSCAWRTWMPWTCLLILTSPD